MIDLPPPWDAAYRDALEILGAVQWASWEAAGLLGEPATDPLGVPDAERDVKGQGPTPSPAGLLGPLAALWIISEESDPRAQLIRQALPCIHAARNAASEKLSVKVGPVHAKSVAEALLRAAKMVTDELKTSFGCGGLVRIVQDAFPRDGPSDPWEFHIAAAFYLSESDPGRDAAKSRLFSKTEFLRRLETWNPQKAFAAVRFVPLCTWLRDNLAAFGQGWLREDLELEFGRAFQLERSAATQAVPTARTDLAGQHPPSPTPHSPPLETPTEAPVPQGADSALQEIDVKILRCLAKFAPLMVVQVDIAENVRAARRTVGKRLKVLRDLGYTVRPRGNNGGETITLRGRCVLEEITSKRAQIAH